MKGEDEPNDYPIILRPHRSIVRDSPDPSNSETHAFYTDFKDLVKRISSLKWMETWKLKTSDESLTIASPDRDMTSRKFQIFVDISLHFTIRVYNYLLPEDHDLYKIYHRSLKHITISNLLSELSKSILCKGVENKSFSGKLIHHSVPYLFDTTHDNYGDNEEAAVVPFRSIAYCRTARCLDLGAERCAPCTEYDTSETSAKRIAKKKIQKPMKDKAPISAPSTERIKLTFGYLRNRCSQLEAEIEAMRKELKKSSVQIDDQLTNDFINIMGEQTNVTPFMKIFWDEQKKLFQRTEKGARFHPEIIRFCLSLSIRSPSVYNELRNTGILRLPSLRTLRDYKNYIRPKTGFCRKVLDELTKKTRHFPASKRYICIVFDEMKIKSNLVFDRHTGELIGFLDLGDPDINFASLEKEDELATHVLVFFIRGLCENLSFSLAHFATNNVNALQTFLLFWEAVCLLETVCNLIVLGATCDGANANRSFFKMHKLLDPDNTRNITYRTKNIYAPHRYIYFFSDPPHLIKTARNCLANSAPGEGKRYLWNNGRHLLWQHISELFYTELDNCGKVVHKLTVDHIKLNAYSRMTVKFAAQVLSERVATNFVK